MAVTTHRTIFPSSPLVSRTVLAVAPEMFTHAGEPPSATLRAPVELAPARALRRRPDAADVLPDEETAEPLADDDVTGPTSFDVADADPAVLVPVTTQRMSAARSPPARRYVAEVAPPMFVHTSGATPDAMENTPDVLTAAREPRRAPDATDTEPAVETASLAARR